MMKKLMLLKGKAFIVLLTFCMFLQACKKELLTPKGNDLQNGLSIAEARQYFEQNFKQNSISKKSMGSKEEIGQSIHGLSTESAWGNKTPLWDFYMSKNGMDGTARLFVPIKKENAYVEISKNRFVQYDKLNYLVMFKDSSNNIVSKIVRLNPTEKWLEGNDKQFYDGKISIANMDGITIGSFSVDNGNNLIQKQKINKLASIGNKISGLGEGGTGGSEICFNYTKFTPEEQNIALTCPCEGKHTIAEYDICTCPTKAVFTRGVVIKETKEKECFGFISGSDGEITELISPSGGISNYYPPDMAETQCVMPEGGPDEYWYLNCENKFVNKPEEKPQLSLTQLLTLMLNLNNAESAFLESHTEISNDLLLYLAKNGETPENIEFEKWTVGYLTENPSKFDQAFKDLLNGIYNEYSPIYLPQNWSIEYPANYFDIEDSYDALALELIQEGLQNTDPIPESYYKNGIRIDMNSAPIRNGKTALGFPRNPIYFWQQLFKLKPEMFNQSNRDLIKSGKSPIVNEQWVKYNPTHQAYLGEQLVHHHEGQGRFAFAIPKKIHQKWNSILHSIRTGKFPKLKGTMNSLAGGMQIFSLLTDFNTGNPDAWLNWFGGNDEVGKVYKQPLTGDYYVITKQIKYKNSSGDVIKAKVTYDVYADYIWDSDEHKYMGVLKLGTFTENVDLNNRWSTEQEWLPRSF